MQLRAKNETHSYEDTLSIIEVSLQIQEGKMIYSIHSAQVLEE